MKMRIFFFVLSVFVGSVISSGYQCRGPNKITPPDDLNQVVNWPSIWNDSLPPIPFASQQSCVWEIAVPDGLYASVVFYKNAPSSVSIAAVYPDGYLAGIDNNDLNPYLFTSLKATINLYKSNGQGAFSFKVLRSKYPSVPHDNIPLFKESTPTTITPNGHLTTFTAGTTVSLVAFGLKNQSEYPFLRQSAIYDGDSTSGAFLGTLYKYMRNRKEVKSSGNTLTVCTWGLNHQFDYTLYMVQDSTNEHDFFTYRGVNCEDGTDCSFQINAVYGTSVLVTSDSHSEFIKNIETFPDDGTLKVYEGAISDSTLVTKLTQYVLDTGVITGFIVTRDSSSANWNKVYDGRKGFVHSFYHGINSNQQDTNETFITTTEAKLYFNYVVRDVDVSGDQTTLTVTVMSDGKQVSSNVYNSRNLPPTTTTSVVGDTYQVKYETNAVSTKGFRIDFSTTSSGYVIASSTSKTPTSTFTTTPTTGVPTLETSSDVSMQSSPSITTSTTGTICNGNHVIDPPADITTAWYYPNGWRETDDPLRYASEQTCVWKINVPKGMYAFLTLSGATNSTTLTVTDSVGNPEWVNTFFDQEPYLFLNPQFTVFLDTLNGTGVLGMKVVWNKMETFNPSSATVIPNTVPTVKSSPDCDKGLVIHSSTNVSLVSVKPVYNNQQKLSDVRLQMRNTVVFDGQSPDDKLIANLWQIQHDENQVVSSGKHLTLFSLIPNMKTDSYALVQDYQNTKQFSVYNAVSCFNQDLCPVIIDSRLGPSAAIRMSPTPHLMNSLSISENSQLTVYTATVSPSHQLVQYTKSSDFIDQKFNGLFTTYVLDKNVAIAYLSSENKVSNWTNILSGRTGVLTSKNLGDISSDQNIQETFTGSATDVFNMTLNVKNAGLTDDATLTVIVLSGGTPVFDEKYTAKRLPPSSIFAAGNGLVTSYDTNGSKTTGMLMDFSFVLSNSNVTTTATTTNSGITASTLETTTKSSSRCLSIILLLVSLLTFS